MLWRLMKSIHRFLTEEPDANKPWPAKRSPMNATPAAKPLTPAPAPTRAASQIMPAPVRTETAQPAGDTNNNAQILGAIVGAHIIGTQITATPADCGVASAPAPSPPPASCDFSGGIS